MMNKARRILRLILLWNVAWPVLAWAPPGRALSQEAAESLGGREEAALRAAAALVADSVVQIRTIGGLDTVDDTQIAAGPTTGLVISQDGYIISSAFNFVQRPASILVTFASGKQAPAELVATDHSRMLVLLKTSGVSDLPVPTFVPNGEIRPGQWAVAVGRTFRAENVNVSVGIVSAVRRMFGRAIQTDAAVSTANYGGPLVDIRGRVLGVLVPMSPQATSEVAGVEWYDSGIGFAVPLSSLAPAIERMKRGEDQYAGLLGISLAGRRPLTSPPELAAVRPDSPAGRAGFKKGDRLVEIDGKPVQTQNDLRRAMGALYAGDQVTVTAMRGDERIQHSLTLVDKMTPFRHAFLGVLPKRTSMEAELNDAESPRPESDDQPDGKESDQNAGDQAAADAGEVVPTNGVEIRAVYPGSPAAEARLQPGDRILTINGTGVKTIAEAIAEMNNVMPSDTVSLSVRRGGESLELNITASRLPTTVPPSLPPADAEPHTSEDAGAAGETLDVNLSAMPQKCKVYVPAAHESGRPHGLLLWLHAPGESDPEKVIRDWQAICDRDGMILVVPTAEDVSHWDRTELEYLVRLMQRVMRQYRPDPRRIVVFGQGGGGGMAYLLALPNRPIFSGIATMAAPLPRQVNVPDSEPTQRLAIIAGLGNEPPADVAQGLKKLSDAGYPLTILNTTDPSGALNDDQRNQLARWIDTLDRF